MLDMSRRESFLECEPGVIRLFGAADIGTAGMLMGWSQPEDGHNWNDGVEAVLAVRLEALLAAGVLPDVKRLREEFAPRKTEVPQVTVEIPPPSVYDALLSSAQAPEQEEVAA